MAKEPIPAPDASSWLDWLKLRQWLQFIRRVIAVEAAVESLKTETGSLQLQVLQLQREVDRLQVQLESLRATIQSSIDDKVPLAVYEIVPALVERETRKLNNLSNQS